MARGAPRCVARGTRHAARTAARGAARVRARAAPGGHPGAQHAARGDTPARSTRTRGAQRLAAREARRLAARRPRGCTTLNSYQRAFALSAPWRRVLCAARSAPRFDTRQPCHTQMKCSKKAHTCCPCRHRCQNVNDERNVACLSYFTAYFGPPTYRVPERFKASSVWLCERHAKAVFYVASKKQRKTGKRRNTGKQLAPAKRTRAAPREAEASVAFQSAGADDDDESDEGDSESDGEESEKSGEDDAREALDGEHVVDMDDSVAFEHTMKKAKKNVKRKKMMKKTFAGDASGMTGGGSEWGMVAC